MTTGHRFEARFAIGGSGYFVREGRSDGAKSAIYFGPSRCSDNIHRHITAIFDVETGEVDNLHLTNEKGESRWKKWSLRPTSVKSDVARWMRDNSEPIDEMSARLMDKDYYCVSSWRVFVGLRLFLGIVSGIFRFISKPLAAMGVMRIMVREDRGRGDLRVTGYVDMSHLVQLLRKFRRFKGLAEAVLPVVVRRTIPRLAKLSLTSVRRMSAGDATLLIPRREGLMPSVVVKGDQYHQVSAVRVFEEATGLFSKMELKELVPDAAKLVSPSLKVPFAFQTKREWS